jgi:hypothetical protein
MFRTLSSTTATTKTRRSAKRAMSPLKPATDVSGNMLLLSSSTSTSESTVATTVAAALAPAPAAAATLEGGAGAGAGAAAPATTMTAAAVTTSLASTSLEKAVLRALDAETAATLASKPWLRLERGMRIQKIREFTKAYPGLSQAEQENMHKFLVKANDDKQINTKAQITYEEGRIMSIKGLKIIRTGDPSLPAVFKIDAGRQTKRVTHAASDD